MFAEEDLLPLSGLQHLQFCARQYALIHVEQLWEENRLTAEGRLMHEHADSEQDEWRDGVRICRGMHIRSLRLGLAGRADIVEFHSAERGVMQPRPVEYKRGRPKAGPEDRIQLCAQALCLEEMLGLSIPEGDLYYGTQRRRQVIALDHQLREATEALIARMHLIFQGSVTPKVAYKPKCDNCSLLALCMPHSVCSKSARRYLDGALRKIEHGEIENP